MLVSLLMFSLVTFWTKTSLTFHRSFQHKAKFTQATFGNHFNVNKAKVLSYQETKIRAMFAAGSVRKLMYKTEGKSWTGFVLF